MERITAKIRKEHHFTDWLIYFNFLNMYLSSSGNWEQTMIWFFCGCWFYCRYYSIQCRRFYVRLLVNLQKKTLWCQFEFKSYTRNQKKVTQTPPCHGRGPQNLEESEACLGILRYRSGWWACLTVPVVLLNASLPSIDRMASLHV